VQTDSLGNVLTGTLGSVTGSVGLCTPLTCCFPTGAEWGSNAFENELKSLGCGVPAAYAESAGSSQWWLYTECPQSAALNALVKQYASVAPYEARFVTNLCLTLDAVGGLRLNSVFVEFDPTCGSCRPFR
jgi:hypothetical protein